MRQLRTILRLRLQAKLNLRQIKTSLRLSLVAVQKICSKAETLDLYWPAIEELDDQQLASRFYPQADTRVSSAFQLPDWSEVYRELKRKGMTKLLLWEEYTQQYPNRCYSYPQYCMPYQQWQKKQKRSMRQHHKAREKLFVDYAGQTVPVVQQDTYEGLSFEQRIQLLAAHAQAIDYLHPRGLPQSVMASLLQCDWLNKAQNILITGPVAVLTPMCGQGWVFMMDQNWCSPSAEYAEPPGHPVFYVLIVF